MAIERVDVPIKKVIFHSYVSLPEGMFSLSRILGETNDSMASSPSKNRVLLVAARCQFVGCKVHHGK